MTTPTDNPTHPAAGEEQIDYGAPSPETVAFMDRINDSEIDLRQVESQLATFEVQRNHYRSLLTAERQKREAVEAQLAQITPLKNSDIRLVRDLTLELQEVKADRDTLKARVAELERERDEYDKARQEIAALILRVMKALGPDLKANKEAQP